MGMELSDSWRYADLLRQIESLIAERDAALAKLERLLTIMSIPPWCHVAVAEKERDAALAEVEQLEQQLKFTPSPERWRETNSQLAAARQEVERLRAKLADSVSDETRISLEQERDEARKAARMLWKKQTCMGPPPEHAKFPSFQEIPGIYPWLEDE